MRSQAIKLARISRGQYQCKECQKAFKGTEVQVDHIQPVLDPAQGFQSWDDYIERLFCPVDKLQVLCKPCHRKKTDQETKLRTETKRR